MTFRTCVYENELTRAMKDGHWPEGCGAELRAHVDACGTCSDLVLVSQTFQSARTESERAALSSSHSLLWWRAQLRRRNAVIERVSRPITIAETLALLVNVFVGVVFIAAQCRHFLHWASWWSELVLPRALHLLPNRSGLVDWNLLLMTSGFGVLMVLSVVVVYLASDKS